MNRKQIFIVGVVALGLFASACERSRTTEQRRDETSTTGAMTSADDKSAATKAAHGMMNARDLKWGPPAPGLPAGAQMAVLDGDPSKPGVFVARLKAPDGYTIRPHSHPTWERLTILSGTVRMGMGDKWDESKMEALNAGGFTTLPANHTHFAKASGESIVEIVSEGPFAINYVDPNDDPRRTTSGGGPGGGSAPAAPAR